MKTLRQTLATILLVLALGIPAFAGDIGGPSGITTPPPLPSDSDQTVITTTPTVPGDSDTSILAALALNFLMSTLSIY